MPVLRSLDRGPRLPNLYGAKMIESPRRHGHHDPRYPASVFALVGARPEDGLLPIAVWENEGGTTPLAEELSISGSKRHDLLALAAYGRYRIAAG